MPLTAFAAMDATLSSDHARPGDFVLLLTDDHKGTWNYDLLSAGATSPSISLPPPGTGLKPVAVRAVNWLECCSGGATRAGTTSWSRIFQMATPGSSWSQMVSVGAWQVGRVQAIGLSFSPLAPFRRTIRMLRRAGRWIRLHLQHSPRLNNNGPLCPTTHRRYFGLASRADACWFC